MPEPVHPDWNRYVRERLSLRLRPEREAEIIQELAQQLDQKYSELISAGIAPEEAIHQADIQVGDWRSLAQDIRAAESQAPPPEPPANNRNLLGGVRHDLVYAARFLRHKPVFACIAAATLAFGIGANTAMFTIVDAVALRGLPYPDSSRLVTLGTHRAKQTDIAVFTSALDFADLRAQAKSFGEIAGISPVWNMITGDEPAERLECLFVSANFLPMLGASPAIGRVFLPSEDQPHKGQVAILGYSYWQRKFGGNSDVLNKQITLDGGVYTIVGVLPAAFRYLGDPLAAAPADIDVYAPLAANPLMPTPRNLRFLKVVARLAPSASIEQARSEVRQIGAGLAGQYPQTNREMAWELHALHEEALGKFRTPVFLLLGAVGFVLLLASANVANLLLARIAERKQEMSVRSALGASSYRILRQLLAESLVLSSLGGVFGIVLALAILRILIVIGPPSLIQGLDIHLDLRAFLFTSAIVVAAAMLSGLMPAWRIVHSEIGSALRGGGRSLTAGTHRFRSGLVVAQVALALVLLVGAGLLIRSFQHLLDVDPGFRAENLVTISTQLPNSARAPEQRTAIYHSLRDQLLAIPGVRQVAAVSRLPMMSSDLTSILLPEGKPLTTENGVEVQYRRTTPEYFATMGIPVRAGRIYDDHDAAASPIAVIDEVAARMIWPGENPVGKRVKVGGAADTTPWTTIIGVSGTIRNFGLDIAPTPTIYVPYAASPLGAPILVIRTERDPAPMINAMAAEVRGAGKGMPAYNVFLMQTLVDRSTTQRRFIMTLLTAFAAGAMLLAIVGVYGSISHTVAQRTREIGLRIALGATPSVALGMILREGVRLTVIGVAAGILAAAFLTRLMQSALFGVEPLDPVVFAIAAAVLGIFALMACMAPAVRATRVDPLVALRED